MPNPHVAAHAPAAPRETVILAGGADGNGPLNPLLTRLGYAVRGAAAGAQALALLRSEPDAIILAEADAPCGDGMTALELLCAAREIAPGAGMILLAGREAMTGAIDALALGAAEVVPKPVDARLLAHRLACLGQRLALARKLRASSAQAALAAAAAAGERADLARSLRRHRDLFDSVPCAITVQDRDLTIVEANQTFLREFCLAPSHCAAIGSRCHEVYKHRAEPCPDCPILATFADGARHQAETVVTDRNGQARNILIWTAPLMNAEGRVEKVMEVSTDITQIRQLQDHLSSLGMMLGSMSHGVKGLLTGLDGGMYRVESGLRKGDVDKIKSGWAIVRHRMERVRKMVLDILYYAKSRELDLTDIDAATFAEDMAMIVEGKAVAGGIAFTRRFALAHGSFQADQTALGSALVNFLENGVDACLCETTGKARELSFGVEVDQAAGRVVFTIADTGVGMDRETREKMFTLFFSSKGSKGTGIGLFISNRIFAQHHGGIEVVSGYGEGTTVRAWLPLLQPEQA